MRLTDRISVSLIFFVGARDILSPVSDREMLEQMTRTFEEDLEEIFTVIDE